MAIFDGHIVCLDGQQQIIGNITSENELYRCTLPDVEEDIDLQIGIKSSQGILTILSNQLNIL